MDCTFSYNTYTVYGNFFFPFTVTCVHVHKYLNSTFIVNVYGLNLLIVNDFVKHNLGIFSLANTTKITKSNLTG